MKTETSKPELTRRVAVALAAGTLAVGAQAQSSSGVTIYGVVDGGVEYARTSATPTVAGASLKSMVTGSSAASRLGLRITEDLGGGLRASAVLEHGFDLDTGTTTGGAFWGRDSYVGLGGAWGEVRLGRTYTPAFWVQLLGDVNRLGLHGNAGNYSQLGPSGFLRAANGVNYQSPSFGGFMVRAVYSFGSESAAAPTDAGRIVGLSAEYRAGKIFAGAYHLARRDVFPAGSSTSASSTYSGGSAQYEFGGFSLAGGLNRQDPAGASTATTGVRTSWWLGALVKVGGGDLRLNGGRLSTAVAAGPNPKAALVAASYTYPLSRRTSLYGSFGRMENNSAARFALESSSRTVALPVAAGADTTGLVLGVRHNF
jgi:predicted porin